MNRAPYVSNTNDSESSNVPFANNVDVESNSGGEQQGMVDVEINQGAWINPNFDPKKQEVSSKQDQTAKKSIFARATQAYQDHRQKPARVYTSDERRARRIRR